MVYQDKSSRTRKLEYAESQPTVLSPNSLLFIKLWTIWQHCNNRAFFSWSVETSVVCGFRWN